MWKYLWNIEVDKFSSSKYGFIGAFMKIITLETESTFTGNFCFSSFMVNEGWWWTENKRSSNQEWKKLQIIHETVECKWKIYVYFIVSLQVDEGNNMRKFDSFFFDLSIQCNWVLTWE